MALDGNGGKEIVKSLNADGSRTRLGKHFSPSGINHILRNEVYTGLWYGDARTEYMGLG